MMGADVIKEPFAVINCDDFYGRDSFQVMGKFLANLPEGSKNTYSMVGFRVGNTLSESGTSFSWYLRNKRKESADFRMTNVPKFSASTEK